jgi:hypothetical protein
MHPVCGILKIAEIRIANRKVEWMQIYDLNVSPLQPLLSWSRVGVRGEWLWVVVRLENVMR